MKYIIAIFIILCIIPQVFAGTVQMSSDKQNYHIDEDIRVQIQIQWENQTRGQIQITGIEPHFHITWQSESRTTQIINGISNSQVFINLNLLAYTAGTYTLWPITLSYADGEEVVSESIEVSITGERITLNPNLPSQTSSSTGTWSTEAQDLSQIQLGNKQTDSQTPILGIDGTPMQDIYGIKPNILPSIFSLWAVIGAGLITLIYFLLQIWRKYSQAPEPNITQKPKKLINYSRELKAIHKQYLHSSKEVFYKHIGQLFRHYLSQNIGADMSKRTLQEAQELLPATLLDIYTKIYFPAYDSLPDNTQNREDIIAELHTLMTQK